VRFERVEIGQLVPFAEIEGELQIFQTLPQRQDFHFAVHRQRVPRKGADVRVIARLVGRGEGEFLLLVRIEHLRVQPDAIVIR